MEVVEVVEVVDDGCGGWVAGVVVGSAWSALEAQSERARKMRVSSEQAWDKVTIQTLNKGYYMIGGPPRGS